MASTASRTAAWTIGLTAVVGLTVLGLTSHGGVPDPADAPAGSLSHGTVIFDSTVLVLREGLEAILVLAAVLAGLRGTNAAMRRPVSAGAGLALLATVATWFAAVWVLGQLGDTGLDVQAATGLLAVVVLMIVMNWFLHRVYWTGWMSHHHRRRRALLAGSGARGALLGFGLLGFTALYREGFEVVLFLQSLRLKAGAGVVLQGVALGAAATIVVGLITFWMNARLPYRRMLVATGILLGFVLVVMVGEGVQEMQLAGWLPATDIGFGLPGWVGTWFALFPTVETIVAQVLAAAFVIGSYFLAEHLKVRRPRRLQADREGDRQERAGREAVDPERREPVGLEEAQEEPDRHVGGRRRAHGPDERRPAHAIAGASQEVGDLQ
jgi:high-affinity iron transporter